jgi:hypothetical protein
VCARVSHAVLVRAHVCGWVVVVVSLVVVVHLVVGVVWCANAWPAMSSSISVLRIIVFFIFFFRFSATHLGD